MTRALIDYSAIPQPRENSVVPLVHGMSCVAQAISMPTRGINMQFGRYARLLECVVIKKAAVNMIRIVLCLNKYGGRYRRLPSIQEQWKSCLPISRRGRQGCRNRDVGSPHQRSRLRDRHCSGRLCWPWPINARRQKNPLPLFCKDQCPIRLHVHGYTRWHAARPAREPRASLNHPVEVHGI